MNKNQKMQFVIGVVLTIACFVWAGLSSQVNYKLGLYLITGLVIGYILQRSQYGFAGVIRKLHNMGNADLARAVIFLIFITSAAILSLQYYAQLNELKVPAMSSVKPISLLTVIGGFLFGLGMIWAGACASGTLADIGDLNCRSLIVIVFFCLGSVMGVWHLDTLHTTFLAKGPKVYMPDYLGHFGAIVFFGVIFVLIILALRRYEQYRQKKGTYQLDTCSDEFKPVAIDQNTPLLSSATMHKFFKERWSLYTGSVLLAIVFITITVTTGKNWGITSTFIYWGGWVLEPLGFDIQGIGYYSENASRMERFINNRIFSDPGSLRNIGILLGALICIFTGWSARFKIKTSLKDFLMYALSGLLMGYGARLADGCNIGAFYSALSSMSLSGLVFGLFMFTGGYTALKISRKCKFTY